VQDGEDVEEFRLDGSGVRQELDIVDEQHAGVQVAAAEVVLLAVPGRDRELAAEFRGAYVADVQRWVQLSARRQVTAYARQAEMPVGHSPYWPAFSTGPDNA
jgi:hypothetical protein